MKNNFINSLKYEEIDEKMKIYKLKKDYEEGILNLKDLNDKQKDGIIDLYKKQIEELQRKLK